MAVVQRKGSKFWHIVLWQDGKQRWFSSKTTNKDLALIHEAQLRASIQGNLERHRLEEFISSFSHVKIDAGLSIHKSWQAYTEQPISASRSLHTLRTKHTAWNALIKWLEKFRPDIKYLHELDRNIAGEYMSSLRGKVSGKTFNNIRTNLRSTVQALLLPGNMKENPFDVILSEPVQMQRGRPFTDKEIKQILKTVTPEWHDACVVALYSGLRFADIANLRPVQVRLHDNVIALRPKKTARFEQDVIIPLHKEARAVILPRMKQEYIFPGIQAGYKQTTRGVIRYFGSVLDRLKIKGNVSFHSFRHTFNDNLAKAGISQEDRMRLTGHSNASTNDIYTHDIESLRKAIDLL